MAVDPELIRQLKLQHGDIFGIELDEVEYVYRALTIDEINFAELIPDDNDKEDYYVSKTVLYPDDFDINQMRAGDVLTLAEGVMSVSGILDVDTVKNYLSNSRERLSSDVISMMKSYIIAAMPSYKDNELDGLTIKQMIEKVVLSEQILSVQQAVMGIQSDGVKVQILTADEYQAMQEPVQENKKLTKEQALRKIKDSEKETVNLRDVPMFDRAVKKAPKPTIKSEDLDPELVIKMMGEATAEDPIAAKLFGKG